jgi:hypothetical protein
LIEQVLTRLEMIVEGSLTDIGQRGDARHLGIGVTDLANHLGGGCEKVALYLLALLGACELSRFLASYRVPPGRQVPHAHSRPLSASGTMRRNAGRHK